MKKLLFILLLPVLLVSAITNSQIGIGTTRPDAITILKNGLASLPSVTNEFISSGTL